MWDALAFISAAIIFVVSGGQLFKRHFSENSILTALVGLLAVVGTLFLVKDVRDEVLSFFSTPGPKKEYLTASEYYLRGNERLQAGNASDALSDFNSALLIKPDYAQALLARGKAYSALGDFKAGIEDVDAAKRAMPSLVEADDLKNSIADTAEDVSLNQLWDDMNSK